MSAEPLWTPGWEVSGQNVFFGFFWRTTGFKTCCLVFTSSAYVCFRHWSRLFFLLLMTSWLTPMEVVEVGESQICSLPPRHSLYNKIWSQGLSACRDRSNGVYLFAVCFLSPSRLLYFTHSALMCKTATVLKLSKRRKKYEKYELILAKYLTLIFLSTFPSIFMLAESSALPSAGKRSDAAWKWYFINI